MKARFGWFLAVLVMGLSLVGCPPIEEIPEVVVPDISDGEVPTEEVPDLPIPDKPEETTEEVPQVQPFWAEYEVQGIFFDEAGEQVGESEEIPLMGFIPSENGPVQLDFVSTSPLYFSSIRIEYRLKNGDYYYFDMLNDWGGFGKGKVNNKSTPFWYDEGTECAEESVAHILVPFSEEILSAKVSVSWHYLEHPDASQGFVFTLLSPDDLDQDYLEDVWEGLYPECSMDSPWEDNDGDSIANRDEDNYKTNPCLSDSDGDGFDDDQELWRWNTNPNDIDDHPPLDDEGEPGKG